MNWVEIIATIFGVLCVWLTIRQNIWSWPTGLVQVVLYISVFYHAKLYSDLILHVIYVILQIWGWYNWLYGGKNKTHLNVTKLPSRSFILWIVLGLFITGGWGYIMANYTDAAAPYWDGFIAVMSLIAQWLLTRKKLESWYFWIAVDIVAIGVYLYKHLYFTTGLYSIFLCLSVAGLLEWKKSLNGEPVPEEI